MAESISSKDLLHNRLGPFHDAGISKLASMELPGVPSSLSSDSISFCSHCQRCKSQVADIYRSSTRHADPSEPLFTTVFVDIWGPIAVSPIRGFRRVLGTACHKTSYVMASLMRSKDESSRYFETFLTQIRSFWSYST
jgi:hypothetical protein